MPFSSQTIVSQWAV